MKCDNLQFDLPLYYDEGLSDEQRASIDAHLPECPLCRLKLDEYRLLQKELRMVEKPAIPLGLLQSVRNSVAAQTSAPTIDISYAPQKSLKEIFDYWLMPYTVGTIGALIMTFVVLTSLGSTRSATTEIALNENAEPTMLFANSNSDPAYRDLSPADDYTKVALEGHAPRVNPAGALVALTKSIMRGEMQDEEVVIVADVFGNGLARISEVVEPPSNANAMRELEKAFDTDPSKAPFLPPTLEPHSNAVRVVLKIQRVDVINIAAKN